MTTLEAAADTHTRTRKRGRRRLLSAVAVSFFLLPFHPIATTAAVPSGLPSGAIAYYDFGAAAGGSIANQAGGAPAALTIRGNDYQVSEGAVRWNANIGSFTFTFPFDSSRGTFAETVTAFPNSFSSGGTLAVRVRLDASAANLGQASSMGLITFRPQPDVNIHRVTPRGIEIHRDGPTDPLYFLVREGNNSIGYNNEFNDEVRSGPLQNPTTAYVNAIVVWDSTTLKIYVDGVLAGTTARLTVDHPTPNYRILAAVQPSLIHSSDNQYFKGLIKSLVLYTRPLSAGEVSTLNGIMSTGAPPVAPLPPQTLTAQ